MFNEEITIGRHKASTPIVFPPMANRASIKGAPGEQILQHYKRIARNKQVGMIIIEHAYIHESGKADPYQLSFASPYMVDKQRLFIQELKAVRPDLLIIAQLSHAGAKTTIKVTGQPLLSASPIKLKEEAARALEVAEIHTLTEQFAQSASYAVQAGYDGVEIHAAHGYLLNQFYSPLTNHRDDAYGSQTLDDRLRFIIETLRKVREAIGNYPLLALRFGGCDYQKGGSTISDALSAVKILQEEPIDFIDLSGGLNGYTHPESQSPGYFSDMSIPIKAISKIPIMLTGGVQTPAQAKTLLENHSADLIGVGRAIFKNPNWA